jgi:hypothetical protein
MVTGAFLERGPDDKKHASPTKRLMDMKKSTYNHKLTMRDKI